MANVTLDTVTKRYEDVVAVNEISFEINDGEFVTLVGPSGCGKSTTMETIAGLTTPTEGTVHIGGQDVTDLPPKDRGVAMVFQNIALFPHMDVFDNISFGLRLRDFDDEEINRRVDNAVETVQMEGMLDRNPDELSGGQRQRVAIARAIVRNPDAFLMDEPLANLDAKLRSHMRTELQRLHKELDITVIYVTHDQAEAMTMSDRIAVINNGALQQLAPPLTCYNEPTNRFVAGFIGSPSMNFFEGSVTENGFTSEFIDVDLDPMTIGLDRDDAVTLGVRPEDVYLVDNADGLSDPTAEIKATTDVLEPMGDEIFVYLLLSEDSNIDIDDPDAGSQLLMSIPPDTEIEGDESIQVVLDRSKIHLFDSAGDAIQHGLVEPTRPDSGTEAEAEGDD